MKAYIPKGSKKSKLIFDVGTSNIKIAEAEERHGYVSVSNSLVIKIPDSIFDDGVIKNPVKLADIIEEGLISGGFKSKNAIVTLTSPHILTREVLLPKSNLKDMMMLVDAEAPNQFPVDISQYSVDFKVLEEVTEEAIQQYKVMLIVTPFKILDGYVALFEKLGIFLEKIDYKGNSYAKLIKQIDDIEETVAKGSTAVIDLGNEYSSVTICKDGQIKFSRVFAVGSKLYNEELLEYPGVTAEVAERIKKENGVVSEEEAIDDYSIAAKHGWEKFSAPLFDEITRVFDFYISRESDNIIDRIMLTGGSSLLPRLIRFISSAFDVRTDYLRCEGVVEFSDPDEDMTIFSTFFAGCVGSILSE